MLLLAMLTAFASSATIHHTADTGMVTESGFKNFTTLTRSLDPRDYL